MGNADSSTRLLDGSAAFATACAENDLSLTDTQLILLANYADYLLHWNSKVNLISRRDETNVWTQHIFASALFVLSVDFHSESRVVDIGTGGGLPGIPLAILRPDLEIMLVDSIHKKIAAVTDILTRLHLTNAIAVAGRAEELSRDARYSHRYDYIVSRAVSSISNIVKWTKHFLRRAEIESASPPGQSASRPMIDRGSLVLLKGGELHAEIREAAIKMKPKSIVVQPVEVRGRASESIAGKKLVIIRP